MFSFGLIKQIKPDFRNIDVQMKQGHSQEFVCVWGRRGCRLRENWEVWEVPPSKTHQQARAHKKQQQLKKQKTKQNKNKQKKKHEKIPSHTKPTFQSTNTIKTCLCHYDMEVNLFKTFKHCTANEGDSNISTGCLNSYLSRSFLYFNSFHCSISFQT